MRNGRHPPRFAQGTVLRLATSPVGILSLGIMLALMIALEPTWLFWLCGFVLSIAAVRSFRSHHRSADLTELAPRSVGRRLSLADRWIVWTIQLSLLLFAAAIHSYYLLVILAAICVAAALLAFQEGGQSQGINAGTLMVLTFFTLCCAIWLANPATKSFVIVLIAAGALFVAVQFQFESHLRFSEAMVDSVALYLIASVLAYYLFGITSPGDLSRAGEAASTFSGLGFKTRVAFPFEAGLITTPLVAACFVAAYLSGFKVSLRVHDLFRFAAFCAAATVLIAGNGRASLVLAAAVGSTAFFAPRALARSSRFLVIAMMFLPFWWVNVFQPSQGALLLFHDTFPVFSRGSVNDLATIQNRTKVWEVVRERSPHMPLPRQLFGYGAQGQITSGISRGYSYLLVGTLLRGERGSAHNSVLQQYLDAGLIGVLILVVACLFVARRMQRYALSKASNRRIAGAEGLAMLLVLTGGASIEASLAPGNYQGPLWLFLLLIIIAATYPPARWNPEDGDPCIEFTDDGRTTMGSVSQPQSRSLMIWPGRASR